MEGDYTYQPLSSPDNIRVLTLQPARNLTDPLMGSLLEAGIEEVQYTALSYSWAMEDGRFKDTLAGRNRWERPPANSSPTKLFILGDVDVFIGENLRDALRRLRERSKRPAFFWVDALCIDQRNPAEKNAQVAMMGKIYEWATQVLAWLGEGEKCSNRAAFHALRCLVAEEAVSKTDEWNEPEFAYELEVPWLLKHNWVGSERSYHNHSPRKCGECHRRDTSSTPPPIDLLAPALLHLSNRRYLDRLWVVQELMIPINDRIMFQWGSYTLPGNPFLLLRHNYRASTYDQEERGKVRIFREQACEPDILNNRAQRSLWNVLLYSNGKLCSDPRDNLYGILGIVTDCAKEIKPNYQYSILEVCGQLAKYSLKRCQLFMVLLNSRVSIVATGGKKSLEGFINAHLPTWMPDIRVMLRAEMPGDELREEDPAALWDYVQPILSDDGLVLSCHLDYFGTIGKPNDAVDLRSWPVSREPDSCGIPVNSTTTHNRDHFFGNVTVSRQFEDDAIVGLRGHFSRLDIEESSGLVGCILCSAYPGHKLFQPMLRPDADNTGRWKIVGSWSTSSHEGKCECPLHAPGERRLYHLS